MNEPGRITTENSERKAPVFLIFSTVVLTIILAVMIFSYFSQKNRMVEMETVLTHEKDSLANELRKLMHGYDTLKSSNDTLNARLLKERERIRRLLEINASNIQLIKTYRAEITTMREIMKSYIVQIDSLNTRNKLLSAENQNIRQKISQVEKTNIELEKVKEELSTRWKLLLSSWQKILLPLP
jgi:Tfp pilus assembly protein PilN